MSPATSAPVVQQDGPRIVFFDGVCGLCNRSVDFVLRKDRRGRLQVSPLQGETAEKLLDRSDRERLGSLVFWMHGRPYRRSAGVVRILWQLGPLWQLLGGLLWLVPRPLRDFGYGVIARNRYRLFGKKETCRLPTEAERARFLP